MVVLALRMVVLGRSGCWRGGYFRGRAAVGFDTTFHPHPLCTLFPSSYLLAHSTQHTTPLLEQSNRPLYNCPGDWPVSHEVAYIILGQ